MIVLPEKFAAVVRGGEYDHALPVLLRAVLKRMWAVYILKKGPLDA